MNKKSRRECVICSLHLRWGNADLLELFRHCIKRDGAVVISTLPPDINKDFVIYHTSVRKSDKYNHRLHQMQLKGFPKENYI